MRTKGRDPFDCARVRFANSYSAQDDSLERAIPPRPHFAELMPTDARQRRQFEKLAHSRVYDFAAMRDHGLADDFVLQVQLPLAIFHHVGEKRGHVASIHLAGMVWNAAG